MKENIYTPVVEQVAQELLGVGIIEGVKVVATNKESFLSGLMWAEAAKKLNFLENEIDSSLLYAAIAACLAETQLSQVVEIRDVAYYHNLATELETMLGERSNKVTSWIIEELRKNPQRIDLAKAHCLNESDKFGNVTDVVHLLIKKLFLPNEQHPWHFIKKFAQQG